MDVQDLAPALLALAEIVQIANRKFNGSTATIKVLVNADVEQKCFQLDLSLVQSLLDQAATFLGQKDVKTAKEIGEWIGLIVGGTTGLFGFWRWLAHQKPRDGITLKLGDVTGTTIITVNGSGNSITVSSETAALATDEEVLKKVKLVLQPLQKDGYNDLTFLQGPEIVDKIGKEDAQAISSASPLIPTEEPQQSTSNIRGTVRIKAAQYEGSAKWSLSWNGRIVDAEMSGQAAEWVRNFQENALSAPPGTILDVSMTETVKLNSQGVIVPYSKPSYVVTEIHSWTLPTSQPGFDFGFS